MAIFLVTGTWLVDHFLIAFPMSVQLLGYVLCFVVVGLGLRYWYNRKRPEVG
jgi:hypothetical protein